MAIISQAEYLAQYAPEKALLADRVRSGGQTCLERAIAIARHSLIADSAQMVSRVYFAEAAALGKVKIGFSRDVYRRMRALQCSSPAPLILLGAIPGSSRTEYHLHILFREWRVNREWFELAPCVRATIDEIIRTGHCLAIDNAAAMDRRHGN